MRVYIIFHIHDSYIKVGERYLGPAEVPVFDMSKIPDVYDCCKYDAIHTHSSYDLKTLDETYRTARQLAELVCPSEYAMTRSVCDTHTHIHTHAHTHTHTYTHTYARMHTCTHTHKHTHTHTHERYRT